MSLFLRPRCIAFAPDSRLQIRTLCAPGRTSSRGYSVQGREGDARKCVQKRAFTQGNQCLAPKTLNLFKIAEDIKQKGESQSNASQGFPRKQGVISHGPECKTPVNTPTQPPRVVWTPGWTPNTTSTRSAPNQQSSPDRSCDEGKKRAKDRVDSSATPTASSLIKRSVWKPSVGGDFGEQTRKTKPGGQKANLSTAARDRLLSSLPSRLKNLVKKNVLADETAFDTLIHQERPERWVCDVLASLIQFELDKPRSLRIKIQQRNRRRSLQANAMLLQEHLRDDGSIRAEASAYNNRTEKQLKLLQRMRDHYFEKLQRLRQLSSPSVTSRVRQMQLEDLVREADRRLQMLQARPSLSAPRLGGDGQHATVPYQSSSRETLRGLQALILPKSASLPARIQHQLSRDLLDSLNEACFDFGQSQDPAFMQKNDWTCPESIDLPVFLFSMTNHLELFERFAAYEPCFGRLRSFRNRYAHGVEATPLDEIIALMSDFEKAAELLQSSSLSTKIKDYRSLLMRFRTEWATSREAAYTIAQEQVTQLESVARAKVQQFQSAPKTEKGEAHVDPVAADGIVQQMTARHAADIRKAWEDTERNLALHAGQQLSRYAVEAQIRRLAETVGSVANSVLSNLSKEHAQTEEGATHDVGVRDILRSLERNLSHVRAWTRINKFAWAGSRADNEKEIMVSRNATEFSKISLSSPEKHLPVPTQGKDQTRRLLGEIAKSLRPTQPPLPKKLLAPTIDEASAIPSAIPTTSTKSASRISPASSPKRIESNSTDAAVLASPIDERLGLERGQNIRFNHSDPKLKLEPLLTPCSSNQTSNPTDSRTALHMEDLITKKSLKEADKYVHRPLKEALHAQQRQRGEDLCHSPGESGVVGNSGSEPVKPAYVNSQANGSTEENNEVLVQSMPLFGGTQRLVSPRAHKTPKAQEAREMGNQPESSVPEETTKSPVPTILLSSVLRPVSKTVGIGSRLYSPSLTLFSRKRRKSVAWSKGAKLRLKRQQIGN